MYVVCYLSSGFGCLVFQKQLTGLVDNVSCKGPGTLQNVLQHTLKTIDLFCSRRCCGMRADGALSWLVGMQKKGFVNNICACEMLPKFQVKVQTALL